MRDWPAPGAMQKNQAAAYNAAAGNLHRHLRNTGQQAMREAQTASINLFQFIN
jgi:hypothetical protein